MNKFVRAVTNTAYTANGAVSNKSTFSPLLDLFSKISAMRGQDVIPLFENAYKQDPVKAILAAFNARDIRGGQGERKLFRDILQWLFDNDIETFHKIVNLVPEYGRWDDLFPFHNDPVVWNFILYQFNLDNVYSNTPSLLAKWMPSVNTSSKTTNALGREFAKKLGFTERNYRKNLARLRALIDPVEVKMSARNWSEIDYAKVPSVAHKNYRKAFSKHDASGYVKYLESVKKGEKKINAATLYPYDLVKAIGLSPYSRHAVRNDPTIEAQWKALPNYAETSENAMVLADVSGSMFSGASNVAPIYVSLSLAIYIAQRNTGAFKNLAMVFSTSADFVELTGNSLKEDLDKFNLNGYIGSTNLQAAFDAILKIAVKRNVPESDMPTKLFIVSDMQFNDPGAISGTNLEAVQKKYENAGYKMPKIIFWNVNAGDDQPAVMDDEVFMVSGCSPSIFKNCINSKAVNPVDLMNEVLYSERYKPVLEALS